MKKSIKLFGNILMLLSLVFIGVKIYKANIDFKDVFGSNVTSFIIIVLLYGIFITTSAISFKLLIKLVSAVDIPFYKILYVYNRANLYKYLPGNVMHYVGRNQLVEGGHLGHADVVLASILEIICVSITAVACTLIFSSEHAFEWIRINGVPTLPFILLAFALFIVVAVYFIFRKKISQQIGAYKHLLKFKSLKILALCIIIYSIFFITTALLYIWIINTFDVRVDFNVYPAVIGLYSLSWFLGYITPGAPGGLGIREAIMSYFFVSIISSDIVIASAVILRIVCILGDVMGFLISWIFKKILSLRYKVI